MKKGMKFADFRVKEFINIGEEALDSKIAFSEKELIEKNLEILCKGLVDSDLIEIVKVEDVDKYKLKSLKNSVEFALPGNPIVIIDF